MIQLLEKAENLFPEIFLHLQWWVHESLLPASNIGVEVDAAGAPVAGVAVAVGAWLLPIAG